MNKTLKLRTTKDIRTMMDPYRLDIIQTFKKSDREPLTVKEIADKMNEPHGKVYYHVKKLVDFGALRLAKTKTINGIVAKYYELNFETINIEDDENDNFKDRIKINETLKLIKKLYDDSRDDCLRVLEIIEDDKKTFALNNEEYDHFKSDSFLTVCDGYFTEESYKGFKDDMLALIKKHSTTQKSEDRLKKNIFISVYSDIE